MSFSYSSKDQLRQRVQRNAGSISQAPGANMANVAPSLESNPFGVTSKYFDVNNKQFGRQLQQNSNNPLQQNSKPPSNFSSSFPLKTQNFSNNKNTTNALPNNRFSFNSNSEPSVNLNNWNQLKNTTNDQNKFASNFPANSFQNQNQNQNNFTIQRSPTTRINLNSQSRQLPQNSSNFSSNNNNNSNFQNNMTSNSVSVYNNNSNSFSNPLKNNLNQNNYNSLNHPNFLSTTAASNTNNFGTNLNSNGNGNINGNGNVNGNGVNENGGSTRNLFGNNNSVGPSFNQNGNSTFASFNNSANFNTNNNSNSNNNNNNNNNNSNNNNSNNSNNFQFLQCNNNYGNNLAINQPNSNNINNQQPQFCNNINNCNGLSSLPFTSHSHPNSCSDSSQQQSQQILNPEQQFLVQAHDFLNNQLLPWVKSFQQSQQYLTDQKSQQDQWRKDYDQRMRRKYQQFDEIGRGNDYYYRQPQKKRQVIVIRQAPKISEEQRVQRAILYRQKEREKRDLVYMKQYGMTYDHYELYLKWKQYDRYREYKKKQQFEKKLPYDFPYHRIGIRDPPKPTNYWITKPEQKKADNPNPHPKPNPNTLSVTVSQFPQIVNLDYDVDFKWLEDPTSVRALKLTGRVQVSASAPLNEIVEAVQLDLDLKNLLKDGNRKHYLKIQSKNKKTYNPNIFMRMLGYKQKTLKDMVMRGSIVTPKIKLPQGYGYNPKQFEGWIVKDLQIFNEHGKITWKGETNIQSADFSNKISIENNAAQCHIPVLKKQAVVQFYKIPNLIGYQTKDQMQMKLRRACKKGAEFCSLNWRKKTWSIIFDFNAQQKKKKEQEQTKITNQNQKTGNGQSNGHKA